jgi:hypothetical protein
VSFHRSWTRGSGLGSLAGATWNPLGAQMLLRQRPISPGERGPAARPGTSTC